jgi:hypothetical protein
MGDLYSDRVMKFGFMSNVTCQLMTAFPSTLEAYISAYEESASYNPAACTTAARNSALTGSSVPYI